MSNLKRKDKAVVKSRTGCGRKLRYCNPEGQVKNMVRGQTDGQLNG